MISSGREASPGFWPPDSQRSANQCASSSGYQLQPPAFFGARALLDFGFLVLEPFGPEGAQNLDQECDDPARAHPDLPQLAVGRLLQIFHGLTSAYGSLPPSTTQDLDDVQQAPESVFANKHRGA